MESGVELSHAVFSVVSVSLSHTGNCWSLKNVAEPAKSARVCSAAFSMNVHP